MCSLLSGSVLCGSWRTEALEHFSKLSAKSQPDSGISTDGKGSDMQSEIQYPFIAA
jgi:hypothetical protein